MKTLTSCELLRVTDGCVSMWESQMQWRSDMLHVDKARHIAVLNINQVVFFCRHCWIATLFLLYAMCLSLVSYCDAKIAITLLQRFLQFVRENALQQLSGFLWQALLNCGLEFAEDSFWARSPVGVCHFLNGGQGCPISVTCIKRTLTHTCIHTHTCTNNKTAAPLLYHKLCWWPQHITAI